MKKLMYLTLCTLFLLASTNFSTIRATGEELPITNTAAKSLSTSRIARQKEFQLTQTELNATTDILVDKILEYPYLMELTFSNGPDDSAYQHLCKIFNGLLELGSREDAVDVLLAKYAQASTSMEDSLSSVYSRILLTLPVYQSRFTPEQANHFSKLYNGDVHLQTITNQQNYS